MKKALPKSQASLPQKLGDIPVIHKMLYEVRDELKLDILQVNHRFDSLEKMLDSRFSALDAKFSTMDSKFSSMDAKFSTMDAKFNSMDAKFSTMDAKFNSMDAKFSTMDSKFNSMDSKFSSIDSNFSSIDSKLSSMQSQIADLHSTVKHMAVLNEEQNSRNQVVLEIYQGLHERQGRVESRMDDVEKNVGVLVTLKRK